MLFRVVEAKKASDALVNERKRMVRLDRILCSAVDSHRKLVALVWTTINVVSFTSILATQLYSHVVRARYARNAESYGYDDDDGGDEQQSKSGDENNAQDYFSVLSQTKSNAFAFGVLYSTLLMLGMSAYGTASVVGFVGASGNYVQPFLASGTSSMKNKDDSGIKISPLSLGIFLGMIIVFSQLSLICAVAFSNIWVFDYFEGREKNNLPPYAVELSARTFSYLFLFFAIIYALFAFLLIVYRSAILEDETKEFKRKDSCSTGSSTNYLP